MTAFVDADVLVRYLTGDPARMAEAVTRLLDQEDDLLVSTVTLAEAGYVMETVYKMPRVDGVESMQFLLLKANVSLLRLEKLLAVEALELCRPSRRVSFADALLWADARASDLPVYTFDRRFPRDDIDVRRVGSEQSGQ